MIFCHPSQLARQSANVWKNVGKMTSVRLRSTKIGSTPWNLQWATKTQKLGYFPWNTGGLIEIRDPHNGVLQSLHNWVVFHPLYTLNKQGPFFLCSAGYSQDIHIYMSKGKANRNITKKSVPQWITWKSTGDSFLPMVSFGKIWWRLGCFRK